MWDWYALLREYIANMAGLVPGISLQPAQIDCPAGEHTPAARPGNGALVAARTAAPRMHGADAASWAALLNRVREPLPQLGVCPLREVRAGGGHLLFILEDAFYTKALEDVLAGLPPLIDPGPLWREDTPAAEALYARRRMWMLARKAGYAPVQCPGEPAVQRGLWLALALAEWPEQANSPRGPLTRRALELRTQEAAAALLHMTHGAAPRNRPALLRASAHVADAAARLLTLGLRRASE